MRDALVRAHAARRTLVSAVCSCGWTGTIGVTADCPACGAPDKARLNPDRAALLELMSSSPELALSRLHAMPLLRNALIHLGLIEAHGERAKPGGNGRRRPPGRSYTMTERGEIALAAHRSMKAEQRERAAIAGITAARHADRDDSAMATIIAATDREAELVRRWSSHPDGSAQEDADREADRGAP